MPQTPDTKTLSAAKIGLWEICFSVGGLRMKTIKAIDLLIGSLCAKLAKGFQLRTSIDSASIKSILIIRPGGIGDAIFLLPFLHALRDERPDIMVDILCESRNVSVFKSQEGIYNKIFQYDKAFSFLKVFQSKYDLIIDSEQWHYLSALTAYFLKPRYCVGFSTRPLRAKLFNHPVVYDENGYELENFKNLFSVLLFNSDSIKTISGSFKIKPDLKLWAKTIVPLNSVAIFLGSSIPLRRLSEAQILDMARHYISGNQYVILVGGNDVKAMGEKIERSLSSRNLLNLVDKISLEQTAAVITSSKLFIGPDSGILHLACAVGTPVVGIFGPGNLLKWKPQGTQDRIITLNFPCSPCTHFGYTIPRVCSGQHPCMKNIDFKQVLKKISI